MSRIVLRGEWTGVIFPEGKVRAKGKTDRRGRGRGERSKCESGKEREREEMGYSVTSTNGSVYSR